MRRLRELVLDALAVGHEVTVDHLLLTATCGRCGLVGYGMGLGELLDAAYGHGVVRHGDGGMALATA